MTEPTGDNSNALAVAYSHDLPFDDVRIRFDQVIDARVARARLRTDDQMNATDATPWAPNRPLRQLTGGDTFSHWPLHAEPIERAAHAAT